MKVSFFLLHWAVAGCALWFVLRPLPCRGAWAGLGGWGAQHRCPRLGGFSEDGAWLQGCLGGLALGSAGARALVDRQGLGVLGWVLLMNPAARWAFIVLAWLSVAARGSVPAD